MEIIKEKIDELYWGKKYTIKECAIHFKISYVSMQRKMAELNISRRNKGNRIKLVISRDELEKYYIWKQYSIKQCANHFGISIGTIWRRLIRLGIPRREQYRGIRLGSRVNIDKDKLRKLYIEKEYSMMKCSKLLGCNDATILTYLRLYNIPTRNQSEYWLQGGEKNLNWQGGKSFKEYPREFNKELKELIRLRDGYKCQLCGMPEIEEDRKLSIHHIDYNKKNCRPNNLITLCTGCNIKVNFNKNKWRKYFEKKIQNIMSSNIMQLSFRPNLKNERLKI